MSRKPHIVSDKEFGARVATFNKENTQQVPKVQAINGGGKVAKMLASIDFPEITATGVVRPTCANTRIAIGKLEIGVFNVDGQYYALPNVCLHQFGPLCAGRISGTLSATMPAPA